jgi:hypothetical protein
VIGKQSDRVVEAADRIFADAFEFKIVLDEVAERARQQHRAAQLLGEGFKTRSDTEAAKWIIWARCVCSCER